MNSLEPLIADLALILICAGVMTLLFKRLKQPVVLGYIVAGFLASPNMTYMPSVTDLEGIHLWSEIGVIFLLFSLGLEFSFRKIHPLPHCAVGRHAGHLHRTCHRLGILFSPSLRKQSEKMSKTFSENLTEREKGGMA